MNGNTLALIFGVIAALLQAAGYYIYLRGMMSRAICPSFSSWSLWAFGSIISLLVYADVAPNVATLLLPITCGMCSVLVAGYALYSRNFSVPDRFDMVVVAADLVVFTLWLASPTQPWAYAALLLDTAITFIPIIRATAKAPRNESRAAWLTWSMAYACLIITGLLSSQDAIPLLLPALYLLLHGIVGILASRTGNTA